ncbi:MAG: biotin transporter BioY [Pseudomonadota bacterium]
MVGRQWALIALFVVMIGVAARLSFALPGSDVPQTAQTVAVLVAGGVLGLSNASLCLILYLAIGALGAPIFAGGSSGAAVLFGPTGGYLAGFWLAACALGYLRDRGWLQTSVFAPVLAAGAGHVLIVGLGALLLSFSVGLPAAWFNGVQPFLIGALAKSVIAGVILIGYFALVGKSKQQERTHVQGKQDAT